RVRLRVGLRLRLRVRFGVSVRVLHEPVRRPRLAGRPLAGLPAAGVPGTPLRADVRPGLIQRNQVVRAALGAGVERRTVRRVLDLDAHARLAGHRHVRPAAGEPRPQPARWSDRHGHPPYLLVLPRVSTSTCSPPALISATSSTPLTEQSPTTTTRAVPLSSA